MTLLSPRKRRTTVRPTTPGTAAAKAALLLVALLAAPAVAQPPGAPRGAPPQGGQPGMLPLPRGYQPRTPPPGAQPASPLQQPVPGGRPDSAGTVMYFQKPADALTATGGGLPAAGDGVAQAGAPAATPFAAPDVPPVRPLPVPPAPAPQFQPAPPIPLGNPPPPAVVYAQPQPQPRPDGTMSTSQKKQNLKEVPPDQVRLPARDKIFGIVYNDKELEAAIMDSIRAELKKDNLEVKESSLRFPPLPAVSPPGVPYQPKTAMYPPRTLFIEPTYVVHRRLHFEDKNTERAGWDLGPLQTLVSAGQFYRGVIFWPYNLASGCVHGFWDTSAGKCLPGSPTPYYLYPHAVTLTGTAAEAGIITGVSFLLQ